MCVKIYDVYATYTIKNWYTINILYDKISDIRYTYTKQNFHITIIYEIFRTWVSATGLKFGGPNRQNY